MILARPALVPEEEFLALPETMERVELLDGEVIVAPSPSAWHQEIFRRLVHSIRSWADPRAEPAFVGMAPLDVRFSPGRILQPDVFVILDSIPFDREGPIEEIPEVCLEILSTNRAYDRRTKRVVYAAAGVRDLWIVEPSGLLERWHGLGLNQAEELTQSLATPLLPEFRLDLAGLFRVG
jgi:Uma2 family endonuclease